MIPFTPSSAVKPHTWGHFLEYAATVGVTLQTTSSPVEHAGGTFQPFRYLQRRDGDNSRVYPLPKEFTMERRLGFGRLAHVCSVLGIREPQWLVEF